jgi:ABC-2 type transport system ATP-binding protein
LLKIEGLTKYFTGRNGAPALDNVSFGVINGQIVGFVGLNGAGKTTTIRIAAGVSLPSAGRVLVDGHDVVSDKVEASRTIGWVPELPNFEPNSSGISLMQYFAGFYGIPTSDAIARSMDLLKSVGLQGAESKKFRTYSQGMKKRFSLAAAMLSEPRNYLFDEVLNGLDPEGIRYFRNLMVELKAKGAAVLLSSHILVEIESLADVVVFIHRGRVVRTTTREELQNVGKRIVKLVIRNVDQRAITYLEGLGSVTREADALYLTSEVDPARVNAELIGMGYQVAEFSALKEGLEEYFLNLIAEAK